MSMRLKTKLRKYFVLFLILSAFILIAMIIDNIYWISASPEWSTVYTVTNAIGTWTGIVYNYTTGQLLNYVFGYRVLGVLSNWRDLSAALTGGFFWTSLVFIYREFLHKRLFKTL